MDSVKSRDECRLCHDTGTMSWEQPNADGTVFRTIEMPCPNGCGGTWHYPAAERDRVVAEPGDQPDRLPGQTDEVDEIGAGFIQAALQNWGWERDGKGGWTRSNEN